MFWGRPLSVWWIIRQRCWPISRCLWQHIIRVLSHPIGEAMGDSIFLKGSASQFLNSEARKYHTYEDAALLLKRHYRIEDKRPRTLARWQSLLLSTEMSLRPDFSLMSVFSYLVEELRKLQKRLGMSYHRGIFLRDQSLMAVEIPSVQVTLIGRLPRRYQQELIRVSGDMSDKSLTAGILMAHLAESFDPWTDVPMRSDNAFILSASLRVAMNGVVQGSHWRRNANFDGSYAV